MQQIPVIILQMEEWYGIVLQILLKQPSRGKNVEASLENRD